MENQTNILANLIVRTLFLFPQLSCAHIKVLWSSSPEQPLWALTQLPETNTTKVFASFTTGTYRSPIYELQRSISLSTYFSIYLYITHLKFPSASFPLHSSLTLSCLISCCAAQLCPTLCDSMDRSPPGSSVHRIQGMVPTQGSNPRLLHLLRCRWIHYHSATRAASLRSYSCQIN